MKGRVNFSKSAGCGTILTRKMNGNRKIGRMGTSLRLMSNEIKIPCHETFPERVTMSSIVARTEGVIIETVHDSLA